MDTLQQRRQDGEKQAAKVRRDQACRLEPDPGRTGQRRQDQDNWRNGKHEPMKRRSKKGMVAVLEVTKMDEAILKEKLAAAEKDLKDWGNLSEILGESKPGQPDYHPWASCLLYKRKSSKLPEGRSYCKNQKYGECVFDNCCNNCMLNWREHHRQFHPNDYRRYVVSGCKDCKQIQKLVADSMKECIKGLKKELDKPNKIKELNSIALKLIEGSEEKMTQSHRDKIMRILANGEGKMERSRLRRCAGIKLADLNLILGELAREGRIRITGDVILLI